VTQQESKAQPTQVDRTPRPLEVRFYAKVAFDGANGCWRWLGGQTRPGGYGRLYLGEGFVGVAHRISWEIHVGPIPDGLRVLHRCDNPPCCNPEHLFLGTSHDNTQDALRKGRLIGPRRRAV
jgi:hypothetical protein